MKLALFDLDHTLLPLDSDHQWAAWCIRKGILDKDVHQLRSDAFYRDYQAGRLDIAAYTAFAAQMLPGADAAFLDDLLEGFMHEVIKPVITSQALALVERYRQDQWHTLLVTATNEFIVSPIARILGFEHLLAVELMRTPQGGWTHQMRGIPSLREGKVQRVQGWLAARGMNWSDVQDSCMYSDSLNDIPLLEAVRHPVATNPEPGLRTLALARGWETLELFA